MSKNSIQTFFSVLLMVGMLLSLAGQARAMETLAVPVQTGLQPQVSYAIQNDLSVPLAEMAVKAIDPVQDNYEIPRMEIPKSVKTEVAEAQPDGALQYSPVTGNMPAPLANFDGINNIAGVAPPDTQGDIGYDPATGDKYYLQWVNLHIQAWDVTNPAAPVALLPAPIPGNQIWAGFGGACETHNDGDPIVLYDEQANRWFISQFSVGGPYYNCIAVSQTSNPAGAYYRYQFLYSNTKMNDYPKYGIWPDGYYMTVNQFTNGSWAGAGVAVYERDQMLTGGFARQIIFDLESVNANFGGMLPVDFEGTPPPAGSPAYFAEVDDSSYGLGPVDEMRIWEFHTDWASNAWSFGLSGQPNHILPIANFNLLCSSTRDCVPQPGTTQRLDGIGDRLMYRLAYRYLDSGEERMVVNHSVDAGSGRAAVRWYELQKSGSSWAITQQATYAGDSPTDDTTHRWMGSISMDRMGNVALGYSMASSSVYPSVGLVGRLVTDPANTLPQGELVAFAGAASQTGINRWGDYSSMSIDPEDGCTFWYTQEYSSGIWNWRTRIIAFKYPTCNPLPKGTITGTVRTTAGAPIAGVRVTAGTFGTITAPDGTYTILAPAGTYDMTTTAFGYLPGSATGVVVVADQTTLQDFVLTTAPMHKVFGTVTDATPGGHSWPLFARIDIAGYPGGAIFTDPQTGYYEVLLPDGFATTLTVNALTTGYTPASQAITIPAADVQLNFGLLADQSTCKAPGYVLVGGFWENFDGVTAPALPSNWAFTRTAGPDTGTAWATNIGTHYPAGEPAVSAPNLAHFNSFSVLSGNAARLHYNVPFDMTSVSPDQVTFQMYHDPGYSSSHDTLQVVVSTNGGTTWTPVGPTFDRYMNTQQWMSHTVSLTAYSSATGLLIGFNAVSAFGNDIHIDNVVVGPPLVCTKEPGAILFGNVYDENTLVGLDGSVVTPDGASPIISDTVEDPDQDPGFYYGFIPAGSAVDVSANYSNAYSQEIVTLNVVDNSVISQDFFLKAGILSSTPTSFEIFLLADTSESRTLTLQNFGFKALDYRVMEINAPLTTVPVDADQDPSLRHLGPKNLNLPSLDGIVYYWDPGEEVYLPYPNLAAGTMISSFASGLTWPWGIGVDQSSNAVWVGDLELGGGADVNHEYSQTGVATGQTIDVSSWVTVFGADMTYDATNGTLWQINVGGDNCIYELSLTTLSATGEKICPAFGTSERGLAYDPITDTFFAGSWNDRLIVRFDRNGTILQHKNVDLPIAGLAYNPSTGHLFVTNNGDTAPFDITVLDVNANYSILGSFNVADLDGGEAGLEFDCNGHLWAANQMTGEVLEIDSGETGVCSYADISWLSEAPVTGTIAPGTSQNLSLTFNSNGLALGDYPAQIRLPNTTPYSFITLPVTLHVVNSLPVTYPLYLPIVRR